MRPEVETVADSIPFGGGESTGSLTKRAGLNAAAYLLDFTARTAVMLIVTPILLGLLGRPLFGVWQVLHKAMVYLGPMRTSNALKWVLANPGASPDGAARRTAFATAAGVWIVILPIALALGALVIVTAPALTHAPPETVPTVRLVAALLVLNFVLSSMVALPESVLEGMNMRYRRMGLRTIATLGGGALTVAAAWAGFGLLGLAGVQILVTLVTAALAWAVARSQFDWFKLERPRWTNVRQFLGLSGLYVGDSLVHRLMMASDVVVLGALLGAYAVPGYTLTSYAPMILLYVVPAMLNSAVPGVGKVLAREGGQRALALLGEMRVLAWLMLAIGGTAILLWNPSFVRMWVGRDIFAGDLVNLLVVLMAVQLVMVQTDSAMIDLTLKVREKMWLGFAAAALSIGLALFAVPRWGILGLCGSFLLGRSILSATFPFLVRSRLTGDAPQIGWPVLRPAATLAVLFAAASFLGIRIEFVRLPVWMVGVALTVLVAGWIAFYGGLTRAQRQAVKGRMRRLLARRSAGAGSTRDLPPEGSGGSLRNEGRLEVPEVPEPRPTPRRIVVVGSTGAGKTTLARRLSASLGLPHVELDALHWKTGWVRAEPHEFRAQVGEAVGAATWVADGQYPQARDLIWRRAELLVWLDYPLVTTLGRLTRRQARRLGKSEELWNGNRSRGWEQFAPMRFAQLMRTRVDRIRRSRREQAEFPSQIAKYPHLRVVRIRSRRQLTEFLESIEPSQATVIELVGPAGAGKTTILSRLRDAGEGIRVMRRINKPESARPIVRSGIRVAWSVAVPAIMRRSFDPGDLYRLLYLRILRDRVRSAEQEGARLIALDEGPLFMLSALQMAPGRFFRSAQGRMLFEEEYRWWISRLDRIVLLDAPVDVLASRVGSREKGHMMKHADPVEFEAFVHRWREAFREVLLPVATGKVVRIDTNCCDADAVARRIARLGGGGPWR
jgi:adenylate kinase family enzyme/O-antigen/teichoic acid export membrane protein